MSQVKLGIVGLGRLGQIHAENLAKKIKHATLLAACSVNHMELEYARKELGVSYCYDNYNDMIENQELDGVVISSPSSMHVAQVNAALDKKLHVFCEKPLGIDQDEMASLVEKIAMLPDQVFMLGFMRRYDPSYVYAKQLVDAGAIGELSFVRCYGIDPSANMEEFLRFARTSSSGGLFVDMSIHDIDLVRWFTGQEITNVWALGNNFAFPELAKYGELELGAALLQLENNSISFLLAGRNCPHGYQVETELIGTKGSLRISNQQEKNLVTVLNEHGVVRPTSQNFGERFENAFYNEMLEFIACIIEKRQPEVKADDGLKSAVVANACSQSLATGQLVNVKEWSEINGEN